MDSRSTISAYHNYLVNGSLIGGFQLGKVGKDTFFIWAPPIDPQNGEPTPPISGNLFDSRGRSALQIDRGLVQKNLGSLKLRKTRAGFSVRTGDGKPFFSFQTIAFRNSYYTRFAGTLFDERGKLIASGVWRDFTVRANVPSLQLA